jgi:O-acetyl-ADP-ribose deacetylase (regulator of RNase III)
MIEFKKNDYFNSDASVLVNTVNCVGIMGKGLALEFRRLFPDMFEEYQELCRQKAIEPGTTTPYYRGHRSEKPPIWIVNFATKQHWSKPSKIEWIDWGLSDLRRFLLERPMDTSPTSIPALGCSNGGLCWEEVKPKIISMCEDVLKLNENHRFYIYGPH